MRFDRALSLTGQQYSISDFASTEVLYTSCWSSERSLVGQGHYGLYFEVTYCSFCLNLADISLDIYGAMVYRVHRFSTHIFPDTLEGRMKKLEDGLASHHRQSTEEALKSVRILASRPKLTAPGALISALELLVENATIGGHPEKDYYGEGSSCV